MAFAGEHEDEVSGAGDALCPGHRIDEIARFGLAGVVHGEHGRTGYRIRECLEFAGDSVIALIVRLPRGLRRHHLAERVEHDEGCVMPMLLQPLPDQHGNFVGLGVDDDVELSRDWDTVP